jgi:ubiquinone/menaquinone biosynthesis C-methylase UbiE
MSTADKTRSRSKPVGWDQQTLTQPHERHDKATRVEAMFNAIAPTYERVNTLASFGQDARWRRRAVRSVQLSGGETILDVCCGTGDVIRTFAVNDPAPGRIIGLDFAREMLDSGRYAGITTPIELIHGDALNLPLGEQSVDVISCAFGVRNFQDLGRGLSEMWRVLRPGGKAVILEFTMPWNPLLRWRTRPTPTQCCRDWGPGWPAIRCRLIAICHARSKRSPRRRDDRGFEIRRL